MNLITHCSLLIAAEEFYLKKNLLIFVLGAAVIIALDQITKSAVMARFSLHETLTVIPGLFNLVYIMNPGAAFGFLADASPTFRYVFFIGVTIAAAGLIVYYLVKSNPRNGLLAGSLTLIFGGAVGNLIDRIRFGAVVDFLDVYLGAAHWPAFNVADSAITVGAILMIWEMLRNRKSKPTSPT